MKNITNKKVKKFLSKYQKDSVYPIAFCFLSLVSFLSFNYNKKDYKNFKSFWKIKIKKNLNVDKLIQDVKDVKNGYPIEFNNYILIANDNYYDREKIGSILLNYLDAILVYATIDDLKYFFEKDFNIEQYNGSSKKFTYYLNKMQIVNNLIIKLFPENYASIIDYFKKIKEKVF